MSSVSAGVGLQYSASQLALFRILFGAYLCQHFLFLLPHSAEIFSREGMLPAASLNPTAVLFPNALGLVDTPLGVKLWLVTLAALSIVLGLGVWRRTVALVVWYGFACLFNRNVLISNPSLAFVGWLLLALALLRSGEPSVLSPRTVQSEEPWRMSPIVYWGAWFLLAAGYTASGLHKLTAPSWRDGTALSHVLSIPLARDVPWREWFLSADPVLLKVMTWGAVAAEVLYLPFALFSRTRAVAWLSMVLMHCGILFFIAFAELSLGMLLVHLFVFDPRWLSGWERLRQRFVVPATAVGRKR